MSSPKYSAEQLQRMAQHALAARDAGDPRWLQLVFGMAMAHDWTPEKIENAIEILAAQRG